MHYLIDEILHDKFNKQRVKLNNDCMDIIDVNWQSTEYKLNALYTTSYKNTSNVCNTMHNLQNMMTLLNGDVGIIHEDFQTLEMVCNVL